MKNRAIICPCPLSFLKHSLWHSGVHVGVLVDAEAGQDVTVALQAKDQVGPATLGILGGHGPVVKDLGASGLGHMGSRAPEK